MFCPLTKDFNLRENLFTSEVVYMIWMGMIIVGICMVESYIAHINCEFFISTQYFRYRLEKFLKGCNKPSFSMKNGPVLNSTYPVITFIEGRNAKEGIIFIITESYVRMFVNLRPK
ncbi:hypothetical protein RF11_03888 [Thelohanellus kitauei]|uniref:Uncharacterized protein n=1 Tax=Thelohanellus kitauei TaxID=669202 RepID=A0A0C2MJF0_THEKT|nr:hypothetical protein RF11_03888 [Thelohanellus kitauei]